MENKHMEAGASVTYNIKSPNGFPLLFTIRDDSEAPLFERMAEVEEYLKDHGYTAEVKTYGRTAQPKEYAGDCPICKGKLVKFTSKMGKSGVQCENRKFDFATKTTSGCEYIKWDADASTNDFSSGGSKSINSTPKVAVGGTQSPTGDKATPAQRNLIFKLAANLWDDNLTKQQASDLIREITGK